MKTISPISQLGKDYCMSVSYTEGHDMEVIKEYFDIEKKINQIEAERFESF